jgi:sulfate transport system ATP-binding protein
VLTLGAQTRIEFKREDDASYVDVEMPRSEFVAVRDRFALGPGSRVHLKPRRVTRFGSPAPAEEGFDPAAMI